jgi:hypothetical protein
MKNQELIINLGFVNAEKLRAKILSGYSEEPNKNGFFLQITDSGLEGVSVWTNCFKSKKEFKKVLFSNLMMNL